MVRRLCMATPLPVWCKIRLLSSKEDTIAFARLLQAAGCSLLAVHGRFREQRNRVAADWSAIANVVEAVDIPVFANGSITSYQGAVKCQEQTGAAGVMVATGLLVNPWAFDPVLESAVVGPGPSEALRMAREYLEHAQRFPPPASFYGRCVRDHLQYMLERDLKPTDRRMWGVLSNPKLTSHRQFVQLLDLVALLLLGPDADAQGREEPTLREVLSSG